MSTGNSRGRPTASASHERCASERERSRQSGGYGRSDEPPGKLCAAAERYSNQTQQNCRTHPALRATRNCLAPVGGRRGPCCRVRRIGSIHLTWERGREFKEKRPLDGRPIRSDLNEALTSEYRCRFRWRILELPSLIESLQPSWRFASTLSIRLAGRGIGVPRSRLPAPWNRSDLFVESL